MTLDTSDNEHMNGPCVHYFVLPLLFCSLILRAQTAPRSAERGSMSTQNSSFQISSTSFQAGGSIPKKYTCDGQDLSPALAWSGAPQNTKAFALIADDPDAPARTWTHWLIWNIPSSVQQLSEGTPKQPQLSDGTRQGQNDFGKIGYNGPCPPPGKPHRYFVRLYALGGAVELKPGASRKELENALKANVLGQTEVMGRYGR